MGAPKLREKENDINQEVYKTILNVKHRRKVCIIRVELLNMEQILDTIVDTGANVNVINSWLLKNIQLNTSNIIRMKSETENDLQILEKCNMSMKINNHIYIVTIFPKT